MATSEATPTEMPMVVKRIAQHRFAQVAGSEIDDVVGLHCRTSAAWARNIEFVGHEFAVGKKDEAAGVAFGEGALVGDHEDGHAKGAIEAVDEVHDAGACLAVEIAGGLVGEKELGLVHQGAGQARRVAVRLRRAAWAVIDAGGEADAFDGFAAELARARGRSTSAKRSGSSTFSCTVMLGMRLKDWKTMPTVRKAIVREFEAGQFREIASLHDDAAAGGTVEPGDEVQERRFAGARAAEQGDEIAGGNFERDPVHGANRRFAHGVVTGDILGANAGAVAADASRIGAAEARLSLSEAICLLC